jgi:hypothetical protein
MKFLFPILFISFSLQTDLSKDHFKLISATGQDWKGGRKETGYGTLYEINMVTETGSENLCFDKLRIGETYFEIYCFQKGKRIKTNTFGSGDTVTIQVNDRIIPKPMPFVDIEDVNSNKENCPDYDGEALLSYIYKGKRKYFEIEKFTRLETLYYP